MIYIRIIDTNKSREVDVPELARSLPFGQAELDRLSSIGSRQRRLESFGALTALYDIISERGDVVASEIIRKADENGKPRFADPSLPPFSLAHSCGFAAAAVGDSEVGIDIELIRSRPRKDELAERFFSSEERRAFAENGTDEQFLLLWTQKEARIKLSSESLARSLSSPVSDGICVFSDVIDVGGARLAITVCSTTASEIRFIIK